MTNHLQKFIIFSLIIHSILITGFSIKWYTATRQSSKSLDVTLVQEKSANNQQADYLADQHNMGGGDSDQKHIPKEDIAAVLPEAIEDQITSQLTPANTIQSDPSEINDPNNPVTTKNDREQVTINKQIMEENSITNNPLIEINDNESMEQTSAEVSDLLQKIADRNKLYAKRTKKRFISASTQEYRDANYLEEWRKKIEYFGNKYYPDQAKDRNLFGDVLMLVAIAPDGQLKYVKIERSSGIKTLDEAAIQAVHLAAPFDQFTPEMRKDTDILEIVRTWRFNEEGQVKVYDYAIN